MTLTLIFGLIFPKPNEPKTNPNKPNLVVSEVESISACMMGETLLKILLAWLIRVGYDGA